MVTALKETFGLIRLPTSFGSLVGQIPLVHVQRCSYRRKYTSLSEHIAVGRSVGNRRHRHSQAHRLLPSRWGNYRGLGHGMSSWQEDTSGTWDWTGLSDCTSILQKDKQLHSIIHVVIYYLGISNKHCVFKTLLWQFRHHRGIWDFTDSFQTSGIHFRLHGFISDFTDSFQTWQINFGLNRRILEFIEAFQTSPIHFRLHRFISDIIDSFQT